MTVTVLLMVDLQNDFMPGGALAVPDGDSVVNVANEEMNRSDIVVATQDWHPPGHGSFASSHPGSAVGDVVTLEGLEQIAWPDHCIANSPGADFHPELRIERIDRVIKKGTDPKIDSYSGFFDNDHRNATDLDDYLASITSNDSSSSRKASITLRVMGLATDYCVKYTVLDACKLGYNVTVIQNGCRGVGLAPDDVPRAFAEMKAAGATIES
ncbi:MAG: bifunctional nicotinamidase/pyrazinamidase [Planctomycetota bacterium]